MLTSSNDCCPEYGSFFSIIGSHTLFLCVLSSYVSSFDLRIFVYFFFQAEDGIRDLTVTGVQTCALPIYDQSDDSRGGTARVRCAAGRLRLGSDGVGGLGALPGDPRGGPRDGLPGVARRGAPARPQVCGRDDSDAIAPNTRRKGEETMKRHLVILATLIAALAAGERGSVDASALTNLLVEKGLITPQEQKKLTQPTGAPSVDEKTLQEYFRTAPYRNGSDIG